MAGMIALIVCAYLLLPLPFPGFVSWSVFVFAAVYYFMLVVSRFPFPKKGIIIGEGVKIKRGKVK